MLVLELDGDCGKGKIVTGLKMRKQKMAQLSTIHKT